MPRRADNDVHFVHFCIVMLDFPGDLSPVEGQVHPLSGPEHHRPHALEPGADELRIQEHRDSPGVVEADRVLGLSALLLGTLDGVDHSRVE